MVLIMMEGFDVQGSGGIGIPEFGNRFPTSPSPTTPGRFGGGYLFSAGSVPFVFPAPLDAGVCGFGYQRITSDAPNSKLFSLFSGGGVTEVIFVRTNASNINLLEVVVGSTVVGSVAKPNAMLATWNYIEAGWSVGATTGTFVLAWNGIQILSLTNLAMGTVSIDRLTWSTPPSSMGIDDLYLLDPTGPAPYNARLGDCRVETILPNADGASSQWLGSDANSLLNYQLVDENPPSSTDYVGASTTGLRDLYGLTDPSGAGAGDILAVQVQAYMAKSDAGVPVGNLNGVLRLSTGEVASTALASGAQIASTYATKEAAIATVDPTGAVWNGASVTNLQAGVEVL